MELSKAIELEPLNVEAYHNRAVIHERRGEKAAAVADYQTAVKYNPQYEPSRRALQRLDAPMPQQPRSDAEKRAVALAEEAAGAARRGDYAEANRKLDEAGRSRRGCRCSTSTGPTSHTCGATPPEPSRRSRGA